MNIPDRILRDDRLSPTAKLLLAIIEDQARDGSVQVRLIDLAETVGCSLGTASRHMNDLERMALIEVRQGKRSTAKTYRRTTKPGKDNAGDRQQC